MLDLKDVFYFVQVVDRGGFTSAGDTLGLPKSTLSHRVKDLEASLGVHLINRTSRQFAVTDVGAEFYQYAVALLQSADVAEQAMRQRVIEPSGTIRLSASAELAQFALPQILPKFLCSNPKVGIVEIATDRLVDVVGEGFDFVIRGHSSALQDSNLIQRPLAKAPWCLFAGAEYLERMPALDEPEHLASHDIVTMVRKGPLQWQLQGPSDRLVTLPIEPRFQSTSMMSLKEAACANVGVATLPGYICRAELRSGILRRVLPGWIAADARFSALVPYRTGLLPAVRSLVDFLAAELPRITAFDPF